MELDVCLSRSGDEPWGFRLVGGLDFHMPLTVVKVVPNSPAELAGLQNGDTVACIEGADATVMTHDDSKVALADAGDSLRLGIVRGLYDPVIDDYDPIYEPIDQDDFDQQSQPTEVPDYLDLTHTLPEYANATPYGDQAGFKPLPDLIGQNAGSRSLTASPFVLPTKPYRPFSTESVPQIPPLEEPIILNPEFHDEFGSIKDFEEFLPKPRFKLPISEQYDPDGTKQTIKSDILSAIDVTAKESATIATESKTAKEATMVKKDLEMKDQVMMKQKIVKEDYDMKEQIMTKQEVKFLEEMKKEIDLETIEKTATYVVDESIEKAMTVAEEIKREIDIELSESSDSETTKVKAVKESEVKETKTKSSKAVSALEKESQISEYKETAIKEVKESVDLLDKTCEEAVKIKERITEKKVSQVEEAESIFDTKETERKVSKSEKYISDDVQTKVSFKKEDVKESEDTQRKVSKSEIKSETATRKDIRDSKQTAYTIGLQTIPNIRGTAHSSYHYDLLLKTFFIHLTDVMVALSRFILAEPVLSKPLEQETRTEISRQEAREDKTEKTISVEKKREDIKTVEKDKESKVAVKEKVAETAVIIKDETTARVLTPAKKEETISVEKKREDIKIVEEDNESKVSVKEKVAESAVVIKDEKSTRILAPAKKERVVGKILQKSQEIKSQEEQQTFEVDQKKVIHDQTYQSEMKHMDKSHRMEEITKRRELSGSRMAQLVEKKPEELMQNMENVLTEFESKSYNEDIEIVRERRSRSRSAAATPVEMMQLDTSQEITSAMSSSMTESKTSRMSESGYETADYETVDGAKTYIAIVQSHVYTNKDAIFEATAQQSTEETVTKEVVEITSAEKSAVKSLETSEKAVQAVVETSSKLVSAEQEQKIEVKQKIEPRPRQIVQKVEEKIIQQDQKSIEEKEIIQKAQKVEEKIVQKEQVSVSAKKEEEIRVKEKIAPRPRQIIQKAQIVEEKVVQEEQISVSAKKEEEIQVKQKIAPRPRQIIQKAQIVEEKVVQQEQISVFAKKEEEIRVKEKIAPRPRQIIQKAQIVEEKVVQEEQISVSAKKEEEIRVKEKIAPRPRQIIQKAQKVEEKVVQEEQISVSIEKEDKIRIKEKISPRPRQVIQKAQKVEETVVQEEQKSVFVEKEDKIRVKEKIEPRPRQVIQKAQKVEEKVILKEQDVVIQEITEPAAEEFKSTFTQNYTVTEAKEEIETSKSEFESKHEEVTIKEEIVEVKDDKKEEAFTFSLAKQEISIKDTLDESAALKISKEQITEKIKTYVEIEKQEDISLKTFESTFVAKTLDQESTFVAKSIDARENLSLDLTQKKFEPIIADNGDLIKTPTPSTVPPTPLTDEYVFSLTTKLPKREGTPIPRDCTPSDDEDEDPHIVKKGLVPHIDANVEEQKIFDPPLPTPPTSPQSPTSKLPGLKGGAPSNPRMSRTPVYWKPGLRGGAPMFPLLPKSPVYFKPGLRGGADREYSQEEIKEIERKSSLLASAIDETIKSIEEYKEEVGIKKQITTESTTEVRTEENGNGIMYNGYVKVVETKIFDNTESENITTKKSKTMEEVTIVEYTNNVEENNIDEEKNQVVTNGPMIIETPEAITESKSENTETTKPTEVQIQEITTIEGTQDIVIENVIQNDIPEENKHVVIEDVTEKEVPEENKREVNEITEVKVEETTVPDIKKYVAIAEEKKDPMEGYKPVPFDVEELNAQRAKRAALGVEVPYLTPSQERELYKTPGGEIIGTHQGIVDGLDESVVDPEVAKELGKPGITEKKIAELISGEAEMLREAHVMGLTRVITSHMNRDDDCSVDFTKIKPIVESLKDSEVLKALNEELLRDAQERKKKEAQKDSWTTFLQKPKRPVPRSKFGYYKDMEPEEAKVETYKPKIVKQPKPKVAPDYKPKDFNTGLLPWEERALREPTPPPVDPEDPILIPEEAPLILEAVDPLPESEVPDLEDSGIPLPPPPEPKEATPPPEDTEEQEELDLDAVLEETERIVEENLIEKEMEHRNVAEQIMSSVQNMVDPNAPLEQQLAQMRAQLAALAELPGVIQHSLEMVTKQLSMLGQAEVAQKTSIQEMPAPDMTPAAVEETEVSENEPTIQETKPQVEEPQVLEPVEHPAPTPTPEEMEKMRREEEQMLEEQRRMEKQKKELMEQARIEHESRQIKQRPTPRVGNPLPDPRVGTPAPVSIKPKPVFGPAAPFERPVVLPGGRKWRTPKDAYNDAFIAETLQGQAELINGKTMGVNFMKYEKPPVTLDHLKDSDVYKMVHNMDMSQPKRVEMLTPVIAEADYREKCRSMTPCPQRLAQQQP